VDMYSETGGKGVADDLHIAGREGINHSAHAGSLEDDMVS